LHPNNNQPFPFPFPFPFPCTLTCPYLHLSHSCLCICLHSAGIFAIYLDHGKKIQSAAKGRCISTNSI